MESSKKFELDDGKPDFDSAADLAESHEASDSDTEESQVVDDPVDGTELLLVDFFRQFAPDRLLRGDAARLLQQCKTDDDVAAVVAELEAEYSPASRAFISEGRNRICFTSAFFDPLLALYDRAALPPVLNVRPLDNVHKAQLLLPGAVKHRARVGILHSSRAAARDRLWRSGLGPAAAKAADPGAGAQGAGEESAHADGAAAAAAAAQPLTSAAGLAIAGHHKPDLRASPSTLAPAARAFGFTSASGRL